MVLQLFRSVSDGVDEPQGLAEIRKVKLPLKGIAASVNLPASIKGPKAGMVVVDN